jgi:hypothetical protein
LNKFPKIAALFLLLVSVAVAQEARPDEQARVYQDNGKWSRQITGSLAAVKNLRVKVDSGVVRVVGGAYLLSAETSVYATVLSTLWGENSTETAYSITVGVSHSF